MLKRIETGILIVSALLGVSLPEQALTQTKPLTIVCQFKESTLERVPDVDSPPQTYVIDLNNNTISTDYSLPVRYVVDAKITDGKIEWKWRVADYSLDRSSGLLTIRNNSTFIWACRGDGLSLQ